MTASKRERLISRSLNPRSSIKLAALLTCAISNISMIVSMDNDSFDQSFGSSTEERDKHVWLVEI